MCNSGLERRKIMYCCYELGCESKDCCECGEYRYYDFNEDEDLESGAYMELEK